MKNEFKNKVILVTGGAGSIGSVIAEELLQYKPKTVRILDIHEFSLYKHERKHADRKDEVFRYMLGDVRDVERLKKAMEGVDIVYHAAAYKHVPFCEFNPAEAVKTNVLGTQNVVEAAIYNKVKKVILISTDKAAHPTGTLGASKLLAEKIITAANYHKGGHTPVFSCVRFGNVTMSSGSVIPNFIYQIKNGGPVTVTSSEMTRFLMSIRQAAELIFRATELMSGGEVFVFKMNSVKIEDLARVIIEEYQHQSEKEKQKIRIKFTGPRPGEKMHEQLLVDDESENVVEMKDLLVLLPSVRTNYKTLHRPHPLETHAKKVDVGRFFSDKCLISKEELASFVRENKMMEME